MAVLDDYLRLLGGEGQPPAGYGQDALAYFDDVLSGKQPYRFDRRYATQPVLSGGQSPVIEADPQTSWTTMAAAPPQPATADVGTGIPLSLDRTPVPDTGEGTALAQILAKLGDIGVGTAGLFERTQLGLENLLNPYVWAGEEPKRSKLPVMPGVQAAADAATFATGGLTSSLFPATGAIRQGMQWAAPMARDYAQDAVSAFPQLLADESGALTARQARQRQIQEMARMRGSPLSGVGEGVDAGLPLPTLDTPPPQIGSNSMGTAPPIEGVPYPSMGLLDPPIVSMGRYSAPGSRALNPLMIPPGAEARTQRMLGRTDPNTGAVVNPEAIELPDGRHVGPVTTEQWVNRVEKTLSDAEITESGNWYRDALPAYEARFGRDKAPAMMGAWLIANQNATPGFAQLSATRALEQYIAGTKGKPESPMAGLAHDKLAQYWDAITTGDLTKLGDLSTGQKIYDFIDSAAGKSTRTFYGDDPRAGRPMVADIHTLRDFGKVDPILHNWIRKTYGDEVANRIPTDSASTPSETKYEWIANRGRKVTEELNAMGWRGRTDWTPEEVQAIGWGTMSAMTGQRGQTAETAIKESERFLSYELDFGKGAPWNKTFPDWKQLTPDEKAAVSGPILNKIMDKAIEITGAQENWRMAGSGAWKQDMNPAFRSSFQASPEAVLDVANIVGYLGQQTATYVWRFANSGNKWGVMVHGQGLDDPAKLKAFWQDIHLRHPDLAGGFSPAKDANGVPGIHIGFDGGGETLKARIINELMPSLDEIGKKHGIDGTADLAKVQSAEPTNNWTRHKDGRNHLQRLGARYPSDLRGRLDDFSRTELEPEIRRAIDETLGRRPAEAPAQARRGKGPPKGVTGAALGGAGLLSGFLGNDAEAALPSVPGQARRPDVLGGLMQRLYAQ